MWLFAPEHDPVTSDDPVSGGPCLDLVLLPELDLICNKAMRSRQQQRSNIAV